MTREEREKALEVWYDITFDDKRFDEARKISIEALKTEPCEDAISRQAVLDGIDVKAWEFCDYLISKGRNDEQKPISHFTDNLREYIRDELPPVNPQPKTGRWIKISPAGIYECSECGQNVMTSDICAYKFCHGCSAKMIEPQEKEGKHTSGRDKAESEGKK